MPEQVVGLSELINRLKQDGVATGEKEASHIIAIAQKKADQIVKEATEQSQVLVLEAEKNISIQKDQMHLELNLAARDFLQKIRNDLKTQVLLPVIKKEGAKLLKKPDFIAQSVLSILKGNLAKSRLEVPLELQEKMSAYFLEKLSTENSHNLEICSDSKLNGFRLVFEGNSIEWDFSIETLSAEIVSLVDPCFSQYFFPKSASAEEDSRSSAA